MADESKKEVTTQLTITALRSKLCAMAGMAMLMEEIRKVPMKEVTMTTVTRDMSFLFHSMS